MPHSSLEPIDQRNPVEEPSRTSQQRKLTTTRLPGPPPLPKDVSWAKMQKNRSRKRTDKQLTTGKWPKRPGQQVDHQALDHKQNPETMHPGKAEGQT